MRQRLLLSLGAVLFTLLAVEVAIRTVDAVRGRGFFSGHRNRLRSHARALPFRGFGIVPYGETDGVRHIVSEHGEPFPIEKPEGTFRVVCFGGSATQNLTAFRSEGIHYPLVLQGLLRERLGRSDVEVINVAHGAYATPHSLILLELDVLEWKPDLVILSHNVNDLTAAYFPDFAFDYSHKYARHVPSLLPPASDVLFQHSQLYWWVRERLDRVRSTRKGPVEPVPDDRVRRRSRGPEPDPVAAAVFRRNLRSFVMLARSAGIEVVLATQPLVPDLDAFLRSVGLRSYLRVATYPLHEEFVAHHAAYNRILLETAEETGAHGFDAAAALGTDGALFVDCVHYTPEGVRRLAGAYAEFLTARGLAPGR